MSFMRFPVRPFQVSGKKNAAQILEDLCSISFQGRTLGQCFHVWKKMLEAPCMIFFGLAGAMVPAGLREVVAYLIDEHLVDCIVSTGANLFHDCYESLGRDHFQTSPHADDEMLRHEGLDRIYDTLAPEEGFRATDDYLRQFAKGLDMSYAYSTREFLYLLGEDLARSGSCAGILTTAYRQSVPIYCPAIADSSIAIALAAGSVALKFDLIKDVQETAGLAAAMKKSGVIYVGGGTPKNFIQQTQVTLSCMGEGKDGHSYAIQISTDAPHWGGLSGCTLEEAQSWGKIAMEAEKVSCHCDATIALPIIVEALASAIRMGQKRVFSPEFVMGDTISVKNRE